MDFVALFDAFVNEITDIINVITDIFHCVNELLTWIGEQFMQDDGPEIQDRCLEILMSVEVGLARGHIPNVAIEVQRLRVMEVQVGTASGLAAQSGLIHLPNQFP